MAKLYVVAASRLRVMEGPRAPSGSPEENPRYVSTNPLGPASHCGVDGTLELSADDAEPFIRNGWVKLGEWIENEPSEGEQIAEQNKPKVTYAPGSLEWEAQQEQERLARIAAEEEKEKRRLALVAAVLGKKL